MKFLKIAGIVVVGLIVLGMLFGGEEEDTSPPEQDDGGIASDTSSPDEPKEQSADCLKAHPTVVKAIGTGLKKKTQAKIVGEGFAVRSDDYKKVWMVAAELDGPRLEGEGDIAVWGTNEDPSKANSSGLILQANGMAEEFSVWGAAAQPGSAADLSPADHGVAEAAECLSAS